MRKNALTICCFSCAAGAIGAFFRWLQNQLAFEESGLSKHSPLNAAVALVIAAAAVWMYFLVRHYMKSGLRPREDFGPALRGTTKLYSPVSWVIGALMLLGGLILFVTGTDMANPILVRVLAALTVLSGVFFPLAMSAARNDGPAPGAVCLYLTLPVAQFCIWLITCYKQNSTNPVVWQYAVEIIAISAALLGFYYLAGYAFGRPSPYKSLYFDMFGAFMCIMSLADDASFGEKLMFISAAAMLLFTAWMNIANMYQPEAPVPEPVQKPAPITENDIGSIIEEVRDDPEIK
jgi:hypothetical protein